MREEGRDVATLGVAPKIASSSETDQEGFRHEYTHEFDPPKR
jgi:hypothetical protein